MPSIWKEDRPMKNNGKSRGMDKKKAEKILATVVMGMNLVNTVAPLAALAGAEQKLVAAPQPARSEAEPLDYAVLPQLADMVDRAIFARAEATEYDGNASVASMVSGDGQNITAGQSGTVSTMNGGTQNISIGGSGTVSTMNGAQQNIASGGVGTVSVMNSGLQYIFSGGKGTVSTMKIGLQNIFSGGSGTVSTMNGGAQQIGSGGVGSALGILGGQQQIASGGTGYVEHVTAKQIISGGGTGIVGTVTAGDSWNLTAGQTGIANSMNGGAQTVSAGGVGTVRALNSGTQAVLTGGTAANTTINGGTQNIASGGTALATEVSGGMMQLASGGIVSGLTMTGGSLELSAVSGSSFAINGTLSATNASIDMTDHSFGRNRAFIPPAYETLTIDKLSGSGNTFIMDTDLGSDNDSNSDKLIIKDADVGTHYVQIRDLSKLNGIQVTGEHKQLLITDNSGKLTFEGKGFNAGGLWDIDPTLAKGDTLGQSANNWYLTKVAKTANNDTRVLLEAANNSYALWRNTNDSLRSRLGALGNGSEHADGIWARTQAGRFSGDNYEGRYNLYQFGYDKADNAKSIYGLAVDYGDGTGSYSPGSGKDKLKSFSLYGIWTTGSGAYTNVTARVGNFSTDLESYGDYPDKASYKQHAYSLSVEYGKRFDFEAGFFVEPQAQFTLGRLAGIDYTTDRGVTGRIDGMNSAIGRIGFVMGQKIENGSDIYLKADLLHEFAGERDLQLTSDAGGTNDILTKHNDYGDTWFELGLGGNVRISRTGNFYGEVTRGFGGDINKKWSVNAGLRFTF
ncbi:autotransporter outer membrane beta-barrel domain-containing protein [uncultured Phascolarctobacterium sp.]|uniref:autotransporter outer membrane beta-barrel domain-containing protein n=1 Tax=uncultured Phascolarctobacterium sp. TaxID=512296 RepID=UPI002594C828|nr:autotransporter outer membrane beta-barrel domain-containing protein [uncultured Phascolarctobacterium sp.]